MAAIPETEQAFVPFTTAERQSFFDAIAAHRRAAWRVTIASALCIAVFSYVVAVLLAPLTYAALILALDLVNFVVRMPNLATPVLDAIDFDSKAKTASVLGLVGLSFVAALPGLVLLGFAVLGVTRAVRASAVFDGGDLPGRPPNGRVLAEQRFANVVSEMALAATIPPPRVLVTASESFNAAAFGRDEAHATIVVSERMLAGLSRTQMQGVAAHLVASIADGDMRIGMRVAIVLCYFGLMGRLGSAIHDRSVWLLIPKLVWAGMGRGRALADRLVLELADPFGNDGPTPSAQTRDLTWRDWIVFPISGPLSFVGFFGGFVSSVVVAPLLSVAWRQRKFMADAAAVRLTRDPDAVAGGLQTIAGNDRTAFAPLVSHLSIVDGGTRNKGIFTSSWVAMFPSLLKRLKALVIMGASVEVRQPPAMAPAVKLFITGAVLIVAPLLALVAVLLTGVSVAMAMIFTGMPVGIVHVLLRWLAGG